MHNMCYVIDLIVKNSGRQVIDMLVETENSSLEVQLCSTLVLLYKCIVMSG